MSAGVRESITALTERQMTFDPRTAVGVVSTIVYWLPWQQQEQLLAGKSPAVRYADTRENCALHRLQHTACSIPSHAHEVERLCWHLHVATHWGSVFETSHSLRMCVGRAGAVMDPTAGSGANALRQQKLDKQVHIVHHHPHSVLRW